MNGIYNILQVDVCKHEEMNRRRKVSIFEKNWTLLYFGTKMLEVRTKFEITFLRISDS